MPGFERGLATAKKFFLPAFAAALLSGCVVGPDYQKPLLAMPASWSGQKRQGRQSRRSCRNGGGACAIPR